MNNGPRGSKPKRARRRWRTCGASLAEPAAAAARRAAQAPPGPAKAHPPKLPLRRPGRNPMSYATNGYAVQLDAVTKFYQMGENQVRALDGVTLRMARGSFW